jgi:prolyl-tRNA synthetase
VSTRLVGGLIMAHGDDKGLRLPPKVAPVQVVIVPILGGDSGDDPLRFAEKLAEKLRTVEWRGRPVTVKVDDREERPGFKFADWELRGVPIRIEVGKRDMMKNEITVVRRDSGAKEQVGRDAFHKRLPGLLDQIQQALFDDALAFRAARTSVVSTYDELRGALESPGGFVTGAWCGSEECEAKVKADTKATIRFVPLEPEVPGAACVVCGAEGVDRATWAQAY